MLEMQAGRLGRGGRKRRAGGAGRAAAGRRVSARIRLSFLPQPTHPSPRALINHRQLGVVPTSVPLISHSPRSSVPLPGREEAVAAILSACVMAAGSNACHDAITPCLSCSTA